MKLLAIENSCGLAVNVRNKKEGIHSIARETKILFSKLKNSLFILRLRIKITIDANPINWRIDDNLYALIDNPSMLSASPAPANWLVIHSFSITKRSFNNDKYGTVKW